MSPCIEAINDLIDLKYKALRLAQPGFAWHVETMIRAPQGWRA